jgi:hypothetical protein
MPKAALRTIAIVYALLLGLTYIAQHPPGWTEGIELRGRGHHTFHVLGHQITLSVEIGRGGGDCEPPALEAWPLEPPAADTAVVSAGLPGAAVFPPFVAPGDGLTDRAAGRCP